MKSYNRAGLYLLARFVIDVLHRGPSGVSAFHQIVSTTHRQHVANRNTVRQNMVFYVSEDAPMLQEKTTRSVLDDIMDESTRVSARRPIMRQFDPSSKAIWRHWRGTIFSETWKSALKQVLWASAVYLIGRQTQCAGILASLKGVGTIWGQCLSISTFTLTFFVNQAYSLFRSVLTIARTLQGRCNDLLMATAVSARRIEPKPDMDPILQVSKYTDESHDLLLTLARYVRLFNIFSYASFTRSHRPLLTPQGMRRMVDRGLLTPKERDVLINLDVAATQRHNVVIMWVLRLIQEGPKKGILEGGSGVDKQTLVKVQEIRAQANYIECELGGRMPFAYAHMVQVLVDSIIYSYPIMAMATGLPFHIGALGSVVLTITFRGLFDLSKQFLDPFHNENFWKGEDPLMVNTFLAETNAGSLRWVNGLEEFPIPSGHLGTDWMKEYVLPDTGYTAEEGDVFRQQRKAAKMEAAAALTKEEYDQMAAEQLEEAQEEYEETQRILMAPPGSSSELEVVDEDDESDGFEFSNETMITASGLDKDTGTFAEFRDAVAEEYEEMILAGGQANDDDDDAVVVEEVGPSTVEVTGVLKNLP